MSFEGSILALNKHVIQNGDMSGDLVSEILDLGEVTGYAVHAIWTGSPDGSLIVSGSNTLTAADFVPVNTQATGAAAGSHLLNVEKFHYKYIMVQYDRDAGSGTLNCYVSGKRI